MGKIRFRRQDNKLLILANKPGEEEEQWIGDYTSHPNAKGFFNPSEESRKYDFPTFNNNNQVQMGDTPTPEEHAEIKSLDIDPNTFDKATYSRLRSMGATHNDVKDALSNGAYIEDYHDARMQYPDHANALDQALSYKNEGGFYKNLISYNKELMKFGPKQEWGTVATPLSPEQVTGHLKMLFGHHLTMKNHPNSTPDLSRAHEWVLSELSKADPMLKKYVRSDDEKFVPERLLSADEHSKRANALSRHYTANNLVEQNLDKFIVNNRLINALNNVASSYKVPSSYRPEKYEED